ncbi:hypothetical protein HYPSUDRAFT_981089 [Hypholoma sublateritium FD-334 SS-4]|uniref:Uncharacterized protein n=1 Tax=Hypholoma sublateritium (strain FD-334 SS-4) TaxID=945553 RepID=A0A0D2Q610_HYPSF|nr:hypothetical protein HYPSUDRAFT_981089 [Hypholoma sublateritium FD-334 SS-4]
MVLGASESAWDVFGGQLALASLLSLVAIAIADDVHFPFFVCSHFLNTGKQEQAPSEYARDISHVWRLDSRLPGRCRCVFSDLSVFVEPQPRLAFYPMGSSVVTFYISGLSGIPIDDFLCP